MNPNYTRLVALLGELFQYDRADLDFGIYRIMNRKREEISRFLDRDLLPQVRAVLEECEPTGRAELRRELEKAVAGAQAAGFDPEQSPKVRELRAELEAAADPAAMENEVFSDLYTFFRRYYSEGDFLSLRRYKEGAYAIPYEGEEVKLHWANADQYYIKSAEHFRDYAWRLPDGRRVHFVLADADTERDDTKAAAGRERRFVLCEEDAVGTADRRDEGTSSHDDGSSNDDGKQVGNGAPAEDGGREIGSGAPVADLRIRFEYRPDAEKQAALNDRAAARIMELAPPEWRSALGTPAPTEKNPGRTLLEKHLADYTARHSFDYFIHKDLGGFLRRELDFFIKNEVMHLDDIEHESAPRVESWLARVKALRAVARKIITFLEGLENFQKRLWLKKKFVVGSGWCITLDRVPEEFYAEIAANDAQRAEWVRLFAIDAIEGDLTAPAYSAPLTEEFLTANPYLVLDTKFFPAEFTERLLATFEDLDDARDGLLVHGENFGALNLLAERYRGQVKCIYIDPPYNTGDDGFLYKDNYAHSSWLAFLMDRLALARSMQTPDGTITVSIDDAELHRITELMRKVYGENELAKLVWDRNRKNDARFFSVGHEYMLVYAMSREYLSEHKMVFREPKEGIEEARTWFDKARTACGGDLEKITAKWKRWFQDIPVSDPRRRLNRYTKVGPRGPYRDDGNISWPGGDGPRYEVLHPVTRKPCKIPSRGWVYSSSERFWQEYESGKVIFGADETTTPRIISYLFESDGQVMPTVFYSYAQTVSQEFASLFGFSAFTNPKNWRDLQRIVRYLSEEDSTILDFFAGSGTTAHAMVNLNREDGGRRKYILVEMGEYFETVLKPRVQKVVYSREWRDGRPVGRNGSGHMFQYLRLESYEDTLNNLELRRTEEQTSLLEAHDGMREEYTLRYMLETESRGSLLSAERFADPFGCTLRVAAGSAGETREAPVDLVETFTWLLGLRVRQRERVRGVLVLRGVLAGGERALVIWRNVHEVPSPALDEFFRKQLYNTRDLEFDVIYVNGDNNLENLRREDETWKVRLIEEEFVGRMFCE